MVVVGRVVVVVADDVADSPSPPLHAARRSNAAPAAARRNPIAGDVTLVRMELVTRVERGQGAADRLLLLVHGLGADENDLAGLLPYLDPEGRFLVVLPRAPIAYGPGWQWYEFAESGADPATFLAAVDAVGEVVDAACEEHDLRPDEAVFGGFSQGASLTLALGLRKSDAPHPAGVLCMSGFLPGMPGLEYDWDAELPPVLVQHGTHDPMLPVQRGRAAAQELAQRGVPTVYGEYPMAHQVALESVEQAAQWLKAVAAGERPSEAVATLDESVQPVDDGPVKTVTTATFEEEVLRSDLPVVVDFWAPWCGPCRQVSPIVEQMARMREGSYKFVKINIDENPQVAQTFDVQSIPLIALFRNGRLERASLGAKPRQHLEAELGMLVIP